MNKVNGAALLAAGYDDLRGIGMAAGPANQVAALIAYLRVHPGSLPLRFPFGPPPINSLNRPEHAPPPANQVQPWEPPPAPRFYRELERITKGREEKCPYWWQTHGVRVQRMAAWVDAKYQAPLRFVPEGLRDPVHAP